LVVGGKSGQFSVGNSLTLEGGNLTNRNLLTQIAGSINITGGSYDFGTFNKSNGTLSNAGTLAITQFNQSGGSSSNTGTLSIGNSDLYGSLTSSGTLTLTGNVTSRGNLSSTGTLNNRGSWTETNAFTIAGNLNNTGAINFQNGFTFASNGKLNSSGTIQTNNASNVFDSLGSQGQTALTTVSINAQFPEETKTALTDLFRHYVPGSVAQNLIVHAKFTGGKVIVTGVNLTQTQAADLTKAFKSKFGSATTLEFQGTIAGVSHDDKLNVAKVNELYDNVESLRDVTIISHNLEGEGKDVEIGENGVKHSAGFKGINEAASITVKDGKTLELVGEKNNSNFLMAAVNTVVEGFSKLVFGSKGLEDTYSGKTAAVHLTDTNAALLVAAGVYESESVSGAGSVKVEQGAVFAIKGASQSGKLDVKGQLDVKGDASLGHTELAEGSVLNNSANLHLTSIDSSAGAVYNQTGGSLQSDSGWFENATLNISGGKLDGSLIKDSEGNAAGLGNNTINIRGNGKNPIIVTTDPAESKKNWKDNLTVVYTPEITSETTVNVYEGGVLQADKLNFDGTTENSVVLAGGALETKLDQVFNDVKRDLLTLDGTDSGGQIGVPTHVLGATSVGSMKEEVKNAVYGHSGLVVFNDEYLKMSGVIDAMQHFVADAENPGVIDPDNPYTPGDTSTGLYLAFTGQVDGKLTVDLANQFDSEQSGGDLAGVVLSHTILYNESASDPNKLNNNLVIGFNEHNHPNANVIDVNQGIGFLSVDGADQVHIEEGKEFVLVGHHDDDDIRTDEDRNNVHSVPDSVSRV
uniref:hypothetical protein n=1 Tax=Turicimonas muris TaxID=1796652 RepID=UPI00272C581F